MHSMVYNQRRFPTPNPLIVYGQEYPWYSPYQFAGNNTIKFIDLDGLEEYDPSKDPYFIARLTLTTFYDIKHSAENILLNTLVPPKDPSKKWQASYKIVNGKEIFETEFKIVSRGSVANEAVSTALDLMNIVAAGRMDPADFMSVKVPVTQITRSVKSISKSYSHGRHLADKNKKWNKVAADIKSTPAKFNPKYDADNLTITAWNKGKEVTNGKDWKVYEFDFDIGANNGKETRYIRVEMTVIGNTEVLHAHPISKESFNKLIKK